MTPGRPRKYHSELERKTAKKEQARKWRLKHRRTQLLQSSEDGLRALIQQYQAKKQSRTRKPTALSNEQKRELAAARSLSGWSYRGKTPRPSLRRFGPTRGSQATDYLVKGPSR